MPSTAGLGQSLEHGVDGRGRRDVDRRVGESARLGLVEHFGVLLGGGDGHDDSFEAWVESRSHQSTDAVIRYSCAEALIPDGIATTTARDADAVQEDLPW